MLFLLFTIYVVSILHTNSSRTQAHSHISGANIYQFLHISTHFLKNYALKPHFFYFHGYMVGLYGAKKSRKRAACETGHI